MGKGWVKGFKGMNVDGNILSIKTVQNKTLYIATVVRRDDDDGTITIRPINESYDVLLKCEDVEGYHILPPRTQKTIGSFKKT